MNLSGHSYIQECIYKKLKAETLQLPGILSNFCLSNVKMWVFVVWRWWCWLYPRLWGFWEECLTIHSPPALFFFKVEISLCTLIPLLRPGSVHSGSASWDNCGRIVPDKLHVNSFPDRFPHHAWTTAWSAHSDFLRSSVYVCLDVSCHVHLWQNDQGLLHAMQ